MEKSRRPVSLSGQENLGLSLRLCMYLLCPRTDLYLGGSATHRREILHDDFTRTGLLPFGDDISSGLQMRDQKGREVGFLASKKSFDCEYHENGKSQCYMSFNISSTGV